MSDSWKADRAGAFRRHSETLNGEVNLEPKVLVELMKPYRYTKVGSVDVHVRPADGCWEVLRVGQRFNSSTHQTRWSAVKAGRLMAEESGSALHIHELDGCVHIDERVQ